MDRLHPLGRASSRSFLEEGGGEADRLCRVGLLDQEKPTSELREDGARRDDLLDLLDLVVERSDAVSVQRAHPGKTTRACGIKADVPEEEEGQLLHP